MSETSTEISRNLTHFQPEAVYSPERPGKQILEIVADPKKGVILKSGDPRDVRAWVRAEQSRAQTLSLPAVNISEVRGGVLFPGLVDAHAHPFIYSGLEIADPIDVSGIETKEDLVGRLRREVEGKEPGKFLVANGLKTTAIRGLTRDDLDRVSDRHKVVVYDPSYHGCVVNSRTLAEVIQFSGKYQEIAQSQLRGSKTPDGHLTEDFVYMTWELIEAEGGIEKLAQLTQEELDRSLTRGVTGLHDMELGTYNEVIANLLLSQKMGKKYPVRQVYLQPRTLKYLLSQRDDLASRGFSMDEAISSLSGFKLYSDGSFGTHTALVDDPYWDTKTKGEIFQRTEDLNDAVKMAREIGLDDIAIHAIGDAGIRRAVELARKWIEAGRSPDNFRIEHFEMPTSSTLDEVGDLGIWVTPQPNFLIDYAYRDRLGDRTKLLCPHKDIINRGIPMMFGTDGMPASSLFAIYMATHAPEESQRLTFDEALLASTLTSGMYERRNSRMLAEGQKADIVVADPPLISKLTSSERIENPGEVNVPAEVAALEANVKKVYLRGELVHSKP